MNLLHGIWYAVKDTESYSSVRCKAVLHHSIGEQELWVANNLSHEIAEMIANDHNRYVERWYPHKAMEKEAHWTIWCQGKVLFTCWTGEADARAACNAYNAMLEGKK